MIDVQGQLAQILDAAHVFNTALRATITTAMGLAIGVITAILSLLPVPTVAFAAKKAQIKAQTGWSTNPTDSQNIKNQLNAFLAGNGYGQYAVQ
jgi:hypothetical protein